MVKETFSHLLDWKIMLQSVVVTLVPAFVAWINRWIRKPN